MSFKNKYLKIAIKSIISLIIDIVLVFAYGFIIGGYTGWLFYLLFILINAGLVVFSFGKQFLNEKITIGNKFVAIILIALVVSYFTGLFYQWTNNAFDNSVSETYYSTIEDAPGSVSFANYYWFYDTENNLKEYSETSIISNPKFEKGDKIYVEEYAGAFGIEHYKLTKDSA